MAINIMITDDHSMIREGLKNLLELDGDIKVIAEAENGEDCLDKLKTFRPDVLLLDINMPKMNGLEVLKALKDRKSKVKVLVLTVHNETEYLMKAVDIGINGYVLKDSESAWGCSWHRGSRRHWPAGQAALPSGHRKRADRPLPSCIHTTSSSISSFSSVCNWARARRSQLSTVLVGAPSIRPTSAAV